MGSAFTRPTSGKFNLIEHEFFRSTNRDNAKSNHSTEHIAHPSLILRKMNLLDSYLTKSNEHFDGQISHPTRAGLSKQASVNIQLHHFGDKSEFTGTGRRSGSDVRLNNGQMSAAGLVERRARAFTPKTPNDMPSKRLKSAHALMRPAALFTRKH